MHFQPGATKRVANINSLPAINSSPKFSQITNIQQRYVLVLSYQIWRVGCGLSPPQAGKFWGIFSISKGEMLQKVVHLGIKNPQLIGGRRLISPDISLKSTPKYRLRNLWTRNLWKSRACQTIRSASPNTNISSSTLIVNYPFSESLT